ncbi:hypothetical protein GY15_07625 [Delftia sp. 670]|nr:hypothetical protein GY15_07625 [Delftia sp. 670]
MADVLQLAHVAGKGERLQPLHGIDPHALGLHAQLPRALLQEVACQHGHVFVALAQRGQAQADDVEAVEQILAEGAVAHALLQVLVGGGDDAHMCLDGLVAAHAVEMPVRQHTQQARLQVERHVADFIEKERAALGLLEAAAPLGLCAREGAALVAEQLGLQQVLGDGGGVDGHEGAARHGRVLVQRARHQFLARARLARDQHRDLALAEPADGAKDVLHGSAWPSISACSGACASATSSRRLSSTARRMSSTALGRSKGLGRYSKAPRWKAETALSRSEYAVMMMTGRPGCWARICSSSSRPEPPGMRISLTSTCGGWRAGSLASTSDSAVSTSRA